MIPLGYVGLCCCIYVSRDTSHHYNGVSDVDSIHVTMEWWDHDSISV